MNFAALVDIHRRAQPSRPALHYEGQVCTWSRLGTAVGRAAYRLAAAGVAAGDRVGLLFRDSPEFVFGFLATMELGACPVPMNTRWSAEDVEFVVCDSAARLLLADGEFAAVACAGAGSRIPVVLGGGHAMSADCDFEAWLREPAGVVLTVPRQDDAMADLTYTAGTSGRPKGVVHHHGFLRRP